MLILKIVFTFLLYFPIICQTRKNDVMAIKENVTSEEGHKNLTVLEKWEGLERKVKNLVKEGIKMALPMLMENSGKLNLTKECMTSSLHLISGLKDLKPWAFEFFDSSGKIFDGIFTASISSLGQYDQCLDIQVKSTKLRDKGKLLFGGQYCMIDIKPPLPPRPASINKIPDIFQNFSQKDTIFAKALEFIGPMYNQGMRLGICVPSTCSKDDLSKIVHLMGSEVYLNTSVYRCEVKEENKFTPVAISVISCYSLIGCLVLVATIIDAFVYNTDVTFKSRAMEVLLAFSFFTNFKKFSSTDASKSNSLRCLNGVRFFGMIWIILLHTYIETYDINIHGWLYILDRIKDFKFQINLNGALSVETFFFMGGLLVTNINIKLYKDRKHKFNIVMFVIHRLLRILPAYAFVIMFSSLIPMLGSGPVWYSKASRYEPCYKYWWTNIVFINNFFSLENQCFPTTWYIASDFQLYVFSLVIIIPLLSWPKIGICASVLTIIGSIIYIGIESYIKEYPPTVGFYKYDLEAVGNYLANFNFKPFIHAAPYAIGLLAGYFLALKPKIKISPFWQVLGWSLAFTACFTVIFGTADWYKNLEAPLVPSILYSSFKRTVWTLGVAWMVICCATGYGGGLKTYFYQFVVGLLIVIVTEFFLESKPKGIINYILSMTVFVQLGRLTFLAYLIHPIVQMITHGNVRVRVQVLYYSMVYSTLGHICISYALAFVVHMLVEVPFANLVRIFLSGECKKEHCSTGKENDFLEANIKAEKKGDVIAVTFVSDGKSNGVKGNGVANTQNL